MGQQDLRLIDPSADANPTGEGEPTARQPRDRPGVLVVDDEGLVRLMLQQALDRIGFHVWLASSGQEAIHLYEVHRDRIGVVLLDVRMPGLDGPATLDAMLVLNPGIPVCFMSGDLGKYTPDELRQRGAAHVIAKPFHLDQLGNTLRRLVEDAPTDLLPSSGAGPDGIGHT